MAKDVAKRAVEDASGAKAGRRPGSKTAASEANRDAEDPRLTRVIKIAFEFPETLIKRHGSHAQFLVRKKTFAYFLDDHHGDGRVAIACKVLPGDNTALIAAQPSRFYMPAYIGSRGWIALRLDIGRIDWEEVREFMLGSFQLVAPKRLAAMTYEDR